MTRRTRLLTQLNRMLDAGLHPFQQYTNQFLRENGSKGGMTSVQRGHHKGKNNSQYGTVWITNRIESKKINKNDTIPEGWIRGRVINVAVWHQATNRKVGGSSPSRGAKSKRMRSSK